MSFKKLTAFALVFVMIFCIAGCQKALAPAEGGEIYLYGEVHAREDILEKELSLWKDCYAKGMRDLFVELPYYTAAFLNIWMQAEDDKVLDEIYADWAGTLSHSEAALDFYKSIKAECPETVFHGTDIGHQYDSAGSRYLRYLKSNGLSDSEEYATASSCREQGKQYYALVKAAGGSESAEASDYRENAMVQNFLREYETVSCDIMGIYGSAHTELDSKAWGGAVDNMGTQLAAKLGSKVQSVNLALMTEPLSTEEITISGKEYTASYFGEEDISSFSENYQSRKFWRIEDSLDDFKGCKESGDPLPYSNYPVAVSEGDVFLIEYARRDGGSDSKYYRAEGDSFKGMPTTTGFIIDNRIF